MTTATAAFDNEVSAPSESTALKPILFSVTDETIRKQVAQFQTLQIKSVNDREGQKLVHKARMDCVRARSAIEDTRKSLKKDSLEYGRKVDAEAKRLTALIEPVEKHLEDEEARIEAELARIQKAKDDALVEERTDKLTIVGNTVEIPRDVLLGWTAEEFAFHLESITKATEARKEAEARAAAEAEERRMAAAEQDRLNKIEAERLAAERAELDRQRAAQEAAAKAEQDRLDAARKQQEEQQRQIAAERQRLEDEAEAQRQKIEREEADSLEAERLRIEEEDRKRKAAEDAKVAAARAEQLRPDVEKIVAMAGLLRCVAMPEVSSPVAREFIQDLRADIEEIAVACENFSRRIA